MSPLDKNSDPNKLFLLPAYVLFETARAVLTYAALHSGVSISSTFVTLGSESAKAIFTTVFLLRWISKEYGQVSIWSFLATIHTIVNKSENDSRSLVYFRSYVKYMVPSFLYLINNILYLVALKLTTPALLHVAILAKLPITAILHHYLIQPQRNGRSWLSLITLSFGLLITNIPAGFSQWLINGTFDGEEPVPFTFGVVLGPFIGVVVAIISGFTSIYMETVMKQKVPFWVAQFWLYLFGTIFAGIAYTLWDGHSHQTDEPASSPVQLLPGIPLAVIAVIATTAGTGLCVANILRKKDNLVKLVGTSASIVTIIIAQCIVFPDLRQKTFTVQTVIGAGVISISVWTYNYYKDHKPRSHDYAAVRLGSLEEEDFEDENDESRKDNKSAKEIKAEKTDNYQPTTKRLLLCVFGIALLALLTGWYRSAPNMSQVPEDFGSKEPIVVEEPAASIIPTPIVEQEPTHVPTALPKDPISEEVDDIKRFFIPNNVTPAVWGQTSTSHRCIDEWVDHHARPFTSNAMNWEYSFLKSGCPVYPIPKGGMIFHQYWAGKWKAFNEVSIEAWLATQRLGDGHRLIYWYEGQGPPDDVRQRFTQGEYGKYIEFREFDAVTEAEGICVESMPEWNNVTYVEENGMMLQSLSDIVRVMLLAKYGGVWLDADTIPLRDMTPMLRSGPSAVGLHNDGWNNNILVFGPPNTEVTRRVLDATCSFSANQTIYKERFGSDAVMPWTWYWLWNEGLFKACVSKFNCGVARFPVWFSDGFDEVGPGQEQIKPCEPGQDHYPAGTPIPPTMRTLFTWHNRMGHNDDSCASADRSSLGGAFRRRIKELLNDGLDMNGRDLFPGPGYFN